MDPSDYLDRDKKYDTHIDYNCSINSICEKYNINSGIDDDLGSELYDQYIVNELLNNLEINPKSELSLSSNIGDQHLTKSFIINNGSNSTTSLLRKYDKKFDTKKQHYNKICQFFERFANKFNSHDCILGEFFYNINKIFNMDFLDEKLLSYVTNFIDNVILMTCEIGGEDGKKELIEYLAGENANNINLLKKVYLISFNKNMVNEDLMNNNINKITNINDYIKSLKNSINDARSNTDILINETNILNLISMEYNT